MASTLNHKISGDCALQCLGGLAGNREGDDSDYGDGYHDYEADQKPVSVDLPYEILQLFLNSILANSYLFSVDSVSFS